jgi:phosphoadenosine phosphosulfate reductase
MLTPAEVQSINDRFAARPTVELLRWAWDHFGERAAIGTSFQGAGLVMMHLAREDHLPFPIFTLDTGLLFPETRALKQRLEAFMGCQIESLTPDLSVDEQAAALGPELWKRDPDLCCTQRKVLPLRQKLAGLDCWITGVRRQQTESRAQVRLVEVYVMDESIGREIVKLNPMAHWTRKSIWDYLKEHHVPYNPLHDQGYRSVGCQPCTRRSGVGEDERAGRWTGFEKTECGIHTFLRRKTPHPHSEPDVPTPAGTPKH